MSSPTSSTHEQGSVVFRNFWKKPIGFKLASLWLGSIVFVAIFFDFLPIRPWDQYSEDYFGTAPFRNGHLLGTTQDGLDMFAGLMHGARLSVFVAVVSVIIGGGLGTLIGVMAAYYRGVLDRFVGIGFNIVLAIPNLVLSLALIAIFASGSSNQPASDTRRVTVLMVSLTIVIIPILGRIARSTTLQWANREFVIASKSIGTKNWEIIRRHVLPNIAPAIFAIGFFAVGVVIIAEGSLAILGIGIPGGASWGSMLAIGRVNIEFSPHEVYLPVICIALTVISSNYFGDYVRARLDRRESKI
jgi:peptide/nickel transport system permease protein